MLLPRSKGLGVFARGILIDMPRLKNVDWIELETPFTADWLMPGKKKQGSQLALLMRFNTNRPLGSTGSARCLEFSY